MAQVLVTSGAVGRADLSSVRRVILSSAHAPPALFARLAAAFPAATLWNAYALTEAGSARTLTRWDPDRPSSVGLPVGETELRIAAEDGSPLSVGEVGEVWLRRRDTPSRSYFRDPEATAAVFVDGWARSGDLGHLDAEGRLHLDDRKKDIVISGGRNISSVEVEDAISEHQSVAEAAVFGMPHPVLGEAIAAAVVLTPSASASERELQDAVRARLAEHKVPRRVVFVDHLPRNASGKVVKGDLRRRFAEPVGPAHVAPEIGLEALVADIWAEVLALEQVGADDDFFALGGHSLAAAQIAARLTDALGRAVGVAAVFEAPTVAELARTLAGLGADPARDDK
jgi:acyl-CoA synthetase (AMP-forming)/AMP-acid ligase II/acyl carrier protein